MNSRRYDKSERVDLTDDGSVRELQCFIDRHLW